MAQEKVIDDVHVTSSEIEICKIGLQDLWHALKEGIDDFNAHPHIVVFLFVFYPLCALLITLFVVDQNLLYLAFPVVSGFTLLGPVVLVGLYEMSRQREQGLDVTWRTAFHFIHTTSFPSIVALSVVLMLLYVAWLFMAQLIYFGLFGAVPPESISDFATQVFTTRRGGALIFYGTVIGFIFAVVALSISLVSFPLLLDKQVSTKTAVATSINAVISNPFVIAIWGLIVSVLLVAGTIVLLVGLIVVVPILGHATWHLYRKLVKP